MDDSGVEYASIWQRLAAYAINFAILSPLMLLTVWGMTSYRLFLAYYFVPVTVLGFWFNIYWVSRYGGTPGTLLVGTKVLSSDLTPVDFHQALIRHSVTFALTTLVALGTLMPTLHMTDEAYFSINYVDRAAKLTELGPKWLTPVQWALNIWILSEFVVIFFNDKRRAWPDFMADTVLVDLKNSPGLP